MGKSNKLKLLLFKGTILASMLALLAGVVGTVYAQSSSGSGTAVPSTGINESDSSVGATSTSYDEQQEALWVSRAQSLIPRIQLAINGGTARGRNTTDMQNALTTLQNTLAAGDKVNRVVNGKLQTERGYRVELRNDYNFAKRQFNIYRATFPDQFTTTTSAVASTGSTSSSSACTTSPSTSSASPTAEATSTMAAVPATGSTSSSTTCTCAAPSTGAVATSTPVASVATTGCAAPATGSTSSSTAAATPVPTATAMPTASTAVTTTATTTATTATTSTTGTSSSAAATPVPTATMAMTATATTVPATGGTSSSSSSNCAAPAAAPTAVPSTTASTGCAAPATGSTSSSASSSTMSLDQFNAFVENNRASTLIGQANVALNSNRLSGRDNTTMTNDLANLRTALAEPVGTQRSKDVTATMLILKRDINQFRAANPELFATSNTGVASTGGTCQCATATPAP